MSEIELYKSPKEMIESAVALGRMYHASGLFGVKLEAQAHVLALECLSMGLPPSKMMEMYHVIDGKLSKRADYMLSRFLDRGGRVKWIRYDSVEARAIFTDTHGESIEYHYSFEEAKSSGIAVGKDGKKENGRRNTADMLRARVISKAIRMLDPAVNSGFYTPEEIYDFGEEKATGVQKKDSFLKKENELFLEELKKTDYEKYLEEFPDRVLSFMLNRGWIQDGQSINDCPEDKMKRVLADPAKFVQACEKLYNEVVDVTSQNISS